MNNLMKMSRQNLFGRRGKNRTILWASLIGIGIGAAAIGLRRNDDENLQFDTPSPKHND